MHPYRQVNPTSVRPVARASPLALCMRMAARVPRQSRTSLRSLRALGSLRYNPSRSLRDLRAFAARLVHPRKTKRSGPPEEAGSAVVVAAGGLPIRQPRRPRESHPRKLPYSSPRKQSWLVTDHLLCRRALRCIAHLRSGPAQPSQVHGGVTSPADASARFPSPPASTVTWLATNPPPGSHSHRRPCGNKPPTARSASAIDIHRQVVQLNHTIRSHPAANKFHIPHAVRGGFSAPAGWGRPGARGCSEQGGYNDAPCNHPRRSSTTSTWRCDGGCCRWQPILIGSTAPPGRARRSTTRGWRIFAAVWRSSSACEATVPSSCRCCCRTRRLRRSARVNRAPSPTDHHQAAVFRLS